MRQTLEETCWNAVLSFEPRPCTTAMMATEIPAAIRPYSMAVAPDSSFTKRETRFVILVAPSIHTWLSELASDRC